MPAIWFNKNLALDSLQQLGHHTMTEFIGIEWLAIGDDYLQATMPVDHRTKQPYGLLHGGANCVLAETLGSVASAMVIDREKFICVGIEINANHVRSARNGVVTGTVTALHLGSTTHVWDIRIRDENEQLVCISRLTVAILPKRN